MYTRLPVFLTLTFAAGCRPVGDDTAAEGCEFCDGIDNDGDGLVDEDFPDANRNGIADCIEDDEEVCDGIDNNGDGNIDEGFPDTDMDGVADCSDPEDCDGIDNNGDGDIDEGYDADGNGVADCFDELCNCADDDGDGEVDEGLDCTYDVTLNASVDDVMAIYVDGTMTGNGSGWSNLYSQTYALPSGIHHIAVEAGDSGGVIAGFNARLTVPGAGATDYDTGSGVWKITATSPSPTYGTTWTTGAAAAAMSPDNAYLASSSCTSTWSYSPSGAPWVWAEDCDREEVYRKNWLYLEVDVCPATADAEECDGIDNDGDGDIDEGYVDSDFDGEADCIEIEYCDGIDNNVNGNVDEGFPDNDGDGIANCIDPEECDGIDNDGDGVVDNGFPDNDGDGIANCIDPETCDGYDNNGDGFVDEGFPDTDADGTADCEDKEECDGLDNNGDGNVDEGYPDSDGDGIADCEDKEECDGIDNDGDGVLDNGFPDTDGDGTADCVDPEECDGLDNNGDGQVDEGFSDSDGDGTADCMEIVGCGDGVLDGSAEECDDGNTTDGDGCAADCTIEDGYSCFTAIDVNTAGDGSGGRATAGISDLIWTWSEYADGSGSVPAEVSGRCASAWVSEPSNAGWVNRYGCGTNTPENTVTYYSTTFELASASAAAQTVLDGTIWADNSVYDIFVNGNSTGVAFGPAGFTGAGVSFGDWPSAYYQAGINTITVAVYNDFGSSLNPDGLLVSAPDSYTVASFCEQTCGDGVLETWELCDDGNTDAGDGCSATCITEETCDGTDEDLDGVIDNGFADTDGNGIADCMEPEACDCVDNDGDGFVDEGSTCSYDVTLKLSADDYWQAWFDGTSWGSGSAWSTLGTLTTTATAGDHAIAVYAYDGFGSLAGMNARVEVTGAAVDAWDTGDGLWLVSATNPSTYGASSTWTTTAYTGMAADSAYLASSGCRSTWGSGTKPSGGEWVWRSSCSNPSTYPANWFLLEFEVCPDAVSAAKTSTAETSEAADATLP